MQFSHIAVAAAFSPRLVAVLAEAWHFAKRFDARLSLIHVGARSEERASQLRDALDRAGLPHDVPVIWCDGDPVEALAGAAAGNGVDLLIAGALTREARQPAGRTFLGTVARGLLRKTPCSLLLFTEPKTEPQPFRKIVAVTDLTAHAEIAFRAALDIAEQEGAESLHVVSVFTPFTALRAQMGEAQSPAISPDDAQLLLDELVGIAAESPVLIDARVIHSTTGLGAADFTKSIGADLLIVPAHADAAGESLLPEHLDWVAQVIPCNLWIVKRAA